LDPNVKWYLAEGSPFEVNNPYVGPAAVAKMMGEVGTFLEFKHEAPELFDAGDAIIARGRYNAVYKPKTRKFTTPFVHIFWLKNGKVVKFEQYIDTAFVEHAFKGE
jgi:uncharacterized protein